MITRKFESGYSKLQKKKEELNFLLNHKKEAMNTFIKVNKKNELENTGESCLNEEHNNITLSKDNNINIGEDNNLLGCVLLKEKCLNLKKYLKHDNLLDLDD